MRLRPPISPSFFIFGEISGLARDGLHYWAGMARLYQEGYAGARVHFATVVERHPKGEYHGESMYRLGVCEKALEDFRAARTTFASFKEKYPAMKQVVEASVFLADMDAAEEKWEDAVKGYQDVVFGIPYTNFPKDFKFIGYAVFEAMAIIEKPATRATWLLSKKHLEDYISTHPGADHSRTQTEIARLEELLGDVGAMLQRLLGTIRGMGGDKHASGVDAMMHQYNSVYWKYHKQYNETLRLLSKLKDDNPWRSEVLGDRDVFIANLVHFPALERGLQDKFLSNAGFRAGFLKDPGGLAPYIEEYRGKLGALPTGTPLETFAKELQMAMAAGQGTYIFRLVQFLDPICKAKGTAPKEQTGYSLPRYFDTPDFQQASAGTLLWMADYNLGTGFPIAKRKAQAALAMVVNQFPESGEPVLSALLSLARMSVEEAKSPLHQFPSRNAYQHALEYYSRANSLFPGSGHARIGQADMFMALGECTKAVEIYRDILQYRTWKGFHAEGHFKVGLCYEQMDKVSMADAFFQKTYVSFLQYAEWAGQAYLHHADCLEKLGRQEDARKVLEEAVRDPRIKKTKAYPKLQASL